MERSLVMKGSLDSFTIEEVLEVVGISRQLLELKLSDARRPVGSILLKSGFVLDARAPQADAGRDAFIELYRRPGRDFAVHRRVGNLAGVQPIGSIIELIRAAREDGGSAGRELVMAGGFDSFSIREVLEVVGISRQWMEIELGESPAPPSAGPTTPARDGAAAQSGDAVARPSRLRGRLVCKSGKLVDAVAGPLTGEEAFFDLVSRPGARFAVYRSRPRVSFGEPVGSLTALLNRAATQAVEEASTVLAGDLQDIPLEEVLEVVGLSRQLLELVFADEGGVLGAILVKAGQVLDAQHARSGTEGRPALQALLRDPGSRFVVQRRSSRARYPAPISDLRSLIATARERRAQPPDPSVATAPLPRLVAAGDVADFGFREIMEVAGISRQYLEILFERDQKQVGSLLVKAGQLLEASTTRGAGSSRDAFFQLAADPGTSFAICRRDAPAKSHRPVESLLKLLDAVPGPAAAKPQRAPTHSAAALHVVESPREHLEDEHPSSSELALVNERLDDMGRMLAGLVADRGRLEQEVADLTKALSEARQEALAATASQATAAPADTNTDLRAPQRPSPVELLYMAAMFTIQLLTLAAVAALLTGLI